MGPWRLTPRVLSRGVACKVNWSAWIAWIAKILCICQTVVCCGPFHVGLRNGTWMGHLGSYCRACQERLDAQFSRQVYHFCEGFADCHCYELYSYKAWGRLVWSAGPVYAHRTWTPYSYAGLAAENIDADPIGHLQGRQQKFLFYSPTYRWPMLHFLASSWDLVMLCLVIAKATWYYLGFD